MAELANSMSHLLGFPKACILDLLKMVFHPSKVPSPGYDFYWILAQPTEDCIAMYNIDIGLAFFKYPNHPFENQAWFRIGRLGFVGTSYIISFGTVLY